jgi:A/G-specific adenine glycosylase
MKITKKLIAWYTRNKRDLPWRKTRDPYKIWVSEIILQQTRIDQGTGYYYRFLDRFPSVRELAAAKEEDVLKTWQGLGYYTRARNMYATAREITGICKWIFPRDYKELLGLKGIGRYTAAAIASLAYGQPFPVMDGNVLRFLSRLYGIEDPVDKAKAKKIIEGLALKLIDKKDPGTFNQAMMEFGSLQCIPKNPRCVVCPFKKDCVAYIKGTTSRIPVKSKSKDPVERWFNYLVFLKYRGNRINKVFINKRTARDIWKNLYDFPLIESKRMISGKQIRSTRQWKLQFADSDAELIRMSGPFRHVLSHQVIRATFYFFRVPSRKKLPYHEIPPESIKNYPMPRPIETFIENDLLKP